MKRYGWFLMMLALLALPMLSQVAVAADDAAYGVDVNMRYRGELDGRDFNADTQPMTFSALRSRIGFWAEKGDLKGYFQFQHPHVFGWNSRTLATSNTVDVHQAYLKIDYFLLDDLSLKLGRTEMAYGDQRLIGPVGWSNVGRTFDGFVFHYKADSFWVDAFATKQAERYSNPQSSVSDDNFAGLWGEVTSLKLNLFLLHRNLVGARPDGAMTTVEARNTVGAYYSNQYKSGLGTTLNVAYQFGGEKNYALADPNVNIGAYLFALKVWYKLEGDLNPSVGLGVDMTSGDDNPTNDTDNAFDNLYYTGHKFRGHMDYFVGNMNAGLRDIYLMAKIAPSDRWNASLTFHNFATTANYSSAVDGSNTTAVGNEVDLDAVYALKDNLGLGAGFGFFMPAEDFAGSTDNGTWGYLMLQTKFDLMK